jgi:hypothetical protein
MRIACNNICTLYYKGEPVLSITTNNLYKEIFYQVMQLEESRCNISRAILHTKNRKDRYKLMISFLCLDLKKHQLFAYAA